MKPSLFAFAATLALAGVADAQTPSAPRPGAPPMKESVRRACENDAQTFCAGTQERERSLCLLNNLDRVSDSCKIALGTPQSPQTPRQQTPAPNPPPAGPPPR
jgi:hypothetical protein